MAVYDYINASAAGDVSTLPDVFDLKVDGVGYSTSGGKIDDETQQWVEAYKSQIIDGEIKVRDTP